MTSTRGWGLNPAPLVAALTVCSILLGSSAAAASLFTYERNGVRLVGGTATKGRLEIKPRSQFPTKDWVPVCAKDVDDGLAEVMCKQLGYTYGRRYYNRTILATSGTSIYDVIKAGSMFCYEKFGHRRQLRGAVDTDEKLRRGRSLLAPSFGELDAPETAPYTCRFRLGTCDPNADVAGIQCSGRPFPPAPSPPPAPPSPRPPPPPTPRRIRIISNRTPNADGLLEPNLCNSTSASAVCSTFARIEIEVNSTRQGAPPIWAPVCNITNSNLAQQVATLACTQRFQERFLPWLPNAYYIWSDVSRTPFIIPSGTVRGTRNFNPATVAGWVTITGPTANPAKLQDLTYRVSTSACAGRAMLAISCSLASNDDAFP